MRIYSAPIFPKVGRYIVHETGVHEPMDATITLCCVGLCFVLLLCVLYIIERGNAQQQLEFWMSECVGNPEKKSIIKPHNSTYVENKTTAAVFTSVYYALCSNPPPHLSYLCTTKGRVHRLQNNLPSDRMYIAICPTPARVLFTLFVWCIFRRRIALMHVPSL